jgi:transcriptional regulator with XRE-family HTH domain
MIMLDQHEEAIWTMADEGKTHRQIGEAIGVMRSTVSRWLNATQERKQTLADSRTHAADGMAEDALEIADSSEDMTKEGIASAKLRIETRQWLAAVWNKDKYGKERDAVVINIGTLHLDALRQAQATPAVLAGNAERLAVAEGVAALQSGEAAIDDVEYVMAGDAFGLM